MAMKTMMHLFELSSVIHYTSVKYCPFSRNILILSMNFRDVFLLVGEQSDKAHTVFP